VSTSSSVRSPGAALTALALFALTALACHGSPPAATPAPEVDPATAAARQTLAREATLDVSAIPERAIAVPPLVVHAADTTLAPLGYGLADLLMTDLSHSAQLVVVDRIRMDAMLRELQLAQAGLVDSSHAPRLGRLIGARRIVVGSLSDRGGAELGIDTRLANVTDGSLADAVSARAPLASILDAEKALAFRLFDELGVTLTPQERLAVEQRPTSNVVALLAYSKGVRDEAFGRYESAAQNYQAAVAADPSFRAARVRMDGATAAGRTSAAPSAQPKGPPAGASALGSSGAAALAGGAINPSPLGNLGLGGGGITKKQQASQSDRGVQTQRQPIYTTVIINVKQLP